MSLWDESGPADDALLSGDVYGDFLFVKKATDFIASHAAAAADATSVSSGDDATSSSGDDATSDATSGGGSGGKPLFLYLALQCSHRPFQAPSYPHTLDCGRSCLLPHRCSRVTHRPFQAPAELLPEKAALRRAGVAPSENTLVQLAMSAVVDEAARNVTAALKAGGLWDSTLLVFSSDNGGPSGSGTYEDVNVPLRGYVCHHLVDLSIPRPQQIGLLRLSQTTAK